MSLNIKEALLFTKEEKVTGNISGSMNNGQTSLPTTEDYDEILVIGKEGIFTFLCDN